MGFPSNISEKALIDCGRHCCLCHKFCGTKIELHHIKQKADGGEDSSENCIPLCFDCHAEVKSYNTKHPKGKAYTESELKRQIDNWFVKVKNSGGVSVNSEYIELDKKIFIKITQILKSDGVMAFVRDNNFAGFGFERTSLAPLHEFEHYCHTPESEFMDVDLEGLKLKLFEYIDKFTSYISVNTFPLQGGLNSVPEEWEYEQPERFEKVVETIHSLSGEIWDTYCELVKLGRRKLAI